jgi:hypothetical protein
VQQAVRPYLDQFAVLGRRLQELTRGPLFKTLREFLERYAAWLERNWALNSARFLGQIRGLSGHAAEADCAAW